MKVSDDLLISVSNWRMSGKEMALAVWVPEVLKNNSRPPLSTELIPKGRRVGHRVDVGQVDPVGVEGASEQIICTGR